MNILFVILIALLILVALLLILGLFIKKEYLVVREVVVNKSKYVVFDYIKLLKNQNKYSYWATMDANMKTEFRGTDGTPGFVSAWDSEKKNVGKGEQEILKVVEGKEVEYVIRFFKPFESTGNASMSTVSLNESQTKVSWAFAGKLKYPMNLMLLLMNMEKAIGSDLEKGLKNLKAVLEG